MKEVPLHWVFRSVFILPSLIGGPKDRADMQRVYKEAEVVQSLLDGLEVRVELLEDAAIKPVVCRDGVLFGVQ